MTSAAKTWPLWWTHRYRANVWPATWIAASVAVNIVAATVQATEAVEFTVIWSFDHNGAFHLVQLVAIGLLVRGLRVR